MARDAQVNLAQRIYSARVALSRRFLGVFWTLGVLLPSTGLAAPQAGTDDQEKKSVEIKLPGTVYGYQEVDLFAKVGGYLKEFSIDIGDRVKHHQVLAELDVPELHSQLLQRQALVAQAKSRHKQALAGEKKATANMESFKAALEEAKLARKEKQANFEYAQLKHKRISNLVNSGSINRDLLDSAKLKLDSASAAAQSVEAGVRTASAKLRSSEASVDSAKADVESAESDIQVAEANAKYIESMVSYTMIKAPFEGVVTKRWFDPGAFIQSADGNSAAKPIFQVTRTDSVKVIVQVSAEQIVSFKKGDRAVLSEIDSLPDMTFEGKISRMAGSLNQSSRMMRVEIDLPNPDGKLLPGYYGVVTFSSSK